MCLMKILWIIGTKPMPGQVSAICLKASIVKFHHCIVAEGSWENKGYISYPEWGSTCK